MIHPCYLPVPLEAKESGSSGTVFVNTQGTV
jgi:hypothetical protein